MDQIELLCSLGFSLHESRVYLTLLRRPFATGYEVAKSAGIPRANVYQVLAGLLEKDAAQLVSDGPARYVAHPPIDVLGRIKRETAARCDALAGQLEALALPAEPAVFWTVRGGDAIVERVRALATEATARIAVCLWADDLSWLSPALREAHLRGCHVIVNVFGEAELEFGEVYRHEDPSKVVGGHLLTMAVDSTAALVAALDAPPGAVYTRHPALVRLVEKLIRDEAYLAAIYARFRGELEEAYGPHLVALRQRLLPTDQARRLLAIVGFGAVDGKLDALLADS
ncbi:MAG: TrmB family transcriptional regulator [Chloroflexota bacterium]